MGGMDYVEHTICECRERVLQGGEETGILHLVSMFVSLFILFARLARLDDASFPLFSSFASLFFTLPRGNNLKENYSCNLCVCVWQRRATCSAVWVLVTKTVVIIEGVLYLMPQAESVSHSLSSITLSVCSTSERLLRWARTLCQMKLQSHKHADTYTFISVCACAWRH